MLRKMKNDFVVMHGSGVTNPNKQTIHIEIDLDIDCQKGRITDYGNFYNLFYDRVKDILDEMIKEHRPEAKQHVIK